MVSGAFKNSVGMSVERRVPAVLPAEGSVHSHTRAFPASERMVSGAQGQDGLNRQCCFIGHPFPRRNRKMAEGSSQNNFARLLCMEYLCITYSCTDLCHQQLMYCHSQEQSVRCQT